MSKPWGMTSSFQMIRPTPVEDKVWEAVEEAIAAGWSPERIVSEVRQAWVQTLSDLSKLADKEFERISK